MTQLGEIRAPIEQEGTKAVVRRWLKAVGEPVRAHEPVVELETDKVAVEVAAEADGVLAEILIDEGADAQPGAVLGRLSAAVEAAAVARVGAVASASAPDPALEPAPVRRSGGLERAGRTDRVLRSGAAPVAIGAAAADRVRPGSGRPRRLRPRRPADPPRRRAGDRPA